MTRDTAAELQQAIDSLHEAREALKPFAALGKELDRFRHEIDSTCLWRIKARDIRIAENAKLNAELVLSLHAKRSAAERVGDAGLVEHCADVLLTPWGRP